VATPGNLVLGLRELRELLSPQDVEFFENCRYGRAVTVTINLDKPVDRCYALSIPRVEKLNAATIIFHDFIDPSTVDNGYRATIIGGGDQVKTEHLLDDFSRIYGIKPI